MTAGEPFVHSFDAADDGTGPQVVSWRHAAFGVYRAGRWPVTRLGTKFKYCAAVSGVHLDCWRFTPEGRSLIFEFDLGPAHMPFGAYEAAMPIDLAAGTALVWRTSPWTHVDVSFSVYKAEPIDMARAIETFLAVRDALRGPG